ncbi:GNAT family N-acetyltransferase [Seonamhaeicola marinus]|uniref:GNAT family N-acetyltransferase n=1 Tax=Seonamhaeicola marinus TaxID=1912246 RepID=A0A5D0HT15_9FLAO|nr:GNAT family N-acetyltransferase [Seonamhaeicola marinus]TYA74448.1 GNAT family N-acetyltransferase [Seonamhaeicola marinus]
MNFHLETERLILRELRLTDLDGLFELDSNPKVHRYLGNKPVKTIEASEKMLRSIINQYEERGIGRWAAIEKSTGDFIGWSGLRLNTEFVMNGYDKFYDVGYRLIPRYWGKGYATESGKAAVNYAFNTLKLPELYGITEQGNEASHKALLKIGLTYVEDFYFEKEQMNLRWYVIKN